MASSRWHEESDSQGDDFTLTELTDVIRVQQRQIDDLTERHNSQDRKLDYIVDRLDRLVMNTNETHSTPKKKPESKPMTITRNISFSSLSDDNNNNNNSDNNNQSAIDQLAAMMANYDHREAPQPESFSVSTGKSIEKFFKQFEAYCYSKFVPGTFELWTSELSKFLRDDLLEMYNALGGGDRDYSVMKKELSDYCDGLRERQEGQRHKNYLSAYIKPGEKLYHFALRLERLFIAIYPTQNADRSTELKLKFMSSIHRNDASVLDQELCLMKTLNKSMVLSWRELKQYLRNKYDIEISSEQSDFNKTLEPSTSVWYTSSDQPQGNLMKFLNEASARPPERDGFGQPQINKQYYTRSPHMDFDNLNYNRKYDGKYQGSRPRPLDRNGSRDQGLRSRSQNNDNSREQVGQSGFEGRCFYCGIWGHSYSRCWHRLGLCVRCGKGDHFKNDCPLPTGRPRSQSQGRNSVNDKNVRDGNIQETTNSAESLNW